MADPFNKIPPAFGAKSGSVVFTNMMVADFTLNATGTLGAAIVSRGQAAIQMNQSVTNSTVGAWASWVQVGDVPLAANYSEGRLLAAGIKWHMPISDVTVPGYASAGLLPQIQVAADLSMTGYQLQGLTGIVPTAGQKTADGQVTWRPLDNSDGQFQAVLTQSNTTWQNTNVPFVYLSGWPATQPIRMYTVMHIECTPKIQLYTGIPSSMNYDAHDWDTIFDIIESGARRIVQTGSQVVQKWAMQGLVMYANRKISSWYNSMGQGRDFDLSVMESVPFTGMSLQALASTVLPDVSQQLADMRAQIAALQSTPATPSSSAAGPSVIDAAIANMRLNLASQRWEHVPSTMDHHHHEYKVEHRAHSHK
jgi:hypothetical protein